MSNMESMLNELPIQKAAKAAGVAVKYQVDPSDPAWLLVQAVTDVEAIMSRSQESARAIESGIGKIPDVIFKSAQRAADDVAASIQGQSDQFVSRLEAGGTKFAENFLKKAQPNLDTSMEKGRKALESALERGGTKLDQASAQLLVALSSEAIQQYIQGRKQEALYTFTEEARRAARAAFTADFNWSITGLAAVIFLLITAGWVANDV